MKRKIYGLCIALIALIFIGCPNPTTSTTDRPTAVTFLGLLANGTSGSVTTTALTLTFDVDPVSLAEADITVTGATKGALTGTGTTRTLALSAVTVTNGANITVAVTNPSGFTIAPSSKTVAVNVSSTILAPLSIIGSWTANQGTIITVSESKIAIPVYSASSDIIQYNNDMSFVIVKWTSHPAGSTYVGKYEKLAWTGNPVSTFDFFEPSDVIGNAISSTVIANTANVTKNSTLCDIFDKNSYFPIVNNATWTDNTNKTVKISNIDYASNTFDIVNVNDETNYVKAVFSADSIGNNIGYGQYSNPWFLPIRSTMAYSPLVYENSKLQVGLTWVNSLTGNGYPINQTIKVDSLNDNITTNGGQQYNNCMKITIDYNYPNGYDQSRYIIKHICYYSKGIGCIQSYREYSDSTSTTYYIVSYNIPN